MSQYNDNNYYGGAAGGGYMTTGSPYGSTAGSPGGFARKSETAHSLRPMTVYQLLQASQAHTDADWILDDQEIGQVTVVAYIASVQAQATNSQYMLDDGSGQIEARHWTDSSMEDESEKNGIVEGAYVRVLGSLKTFGNKKYINTNLIRRIDSPSEIYFHLLEVMYVTMVWERGPPSKPRQEVTPRQNGAGPSTAYSAQPTVTSSDRYSHLPNLHRSIIAFIQAQPSSAEGVHVSAIARTVGGDAVAVSNALDNLTDDGVVYTTGDESHFALC
ncbi:replication protein A subunit RPA32 [Boletus edulis BED1]|uniref:Replication protein A subunit RPA32 n=1 Tax=Boletus edulis BED1 TaxID=1328754 RepID=A0AAD4C3U6_BOLED|nr:replication protein A subunit RPA32 [Boletus edulis BED1]